MPKRFIPPCEGELIVLRLLEKADLPLTLSWRNRDDIRTWFLNSDVIPEEKHRAWFEGYSGLDTDFVFIILAKEPANTAVGQISLYNIDWITGSAEYGRLMIGHPDARGKGYARHATNLLLRIGFEQLGLTDVHLEVKEENISAQKVYLDCGFVESKRQNGLVMMRINSNDW